MAPSRKQRQLDWRTKSATSSLDSRNIDDQLPIAMKWRIAVWSIVVLAILAAYSHSMNGEFVFDDEGAIVENQSIRSIWPLSQSMWAAKDVPSAGRPVVNFSLALNYAVGQLDVVGYHFVNVAIHYLNAALLYSLIRRTLAGFESWRTRPGAAWSTSIFIASLWALHPIQTESVAYVTQRSELLMAFFFLATLYAARRAWDAEERRSSIIWQWIGIVCCALGMGSKEVMVVAPVLVVLYDLMILQQPWASTFQRRWPFYLGLFATWGWLAWLMSSNPRGSSIGFHHAFSPIDYLTTQFWAITNYIWLVLWPFHLCSDYGVFKITQIAIWLPCLLLLLVLAGASLMAWLRRSSLSFLGAWFFLLLAPTSSIVPIVTEPIAERRMYLPLAAMVTLVVVGTIAGAGRFSFAPWMTVVAKPMLPILAIVLGGAYAWGTYARNEVYQDELSFWTDVIEKRPDNSRAYSNLGLLYVKESKLELAKTCFRRAVELVPTNAEALLNLGVYSEDGELDEAIAYYEQATKVDPKLDRARVNLANCYAKQGRIEEALATYGRALEITPTLAKALYSRGLLLSGLKRWDEAIDDFLSAINVDPSMAVAYFQLGNVYLAQKRFDDAVEQYRLAIKADQELEGAYLNLGVAQIRKANYPRAIESIERALKIEPQNADAYSNIGFCYVSLGQVDKAIEAYRQCVAIQPGDAQTWYRLGKLHAGKEEKSEARRCFERVLLLDPKAVEAKKQLEQLKD